MHTSGTYVCIFVYRSSYKLVMYLLTAGFTGIVSHNGVCINLQEAALVRPWMPLVIRKALKHSVVNLKKNWKHV